MHWKDKKVLVIGASGFLGGWLTEMLLAKGASVYCMVRSKIDKHSHLSQFVMCVTILKCDITNEQEMNDALKDRFDFIFHLASVVDVNAALERPLTAFNSSVNSTIILLETVRLRSPSTVVIVASSDKAYGEQMLPYVETNPLLPKYPYEIAKAVQDLLAQFYGKHHGLRIGITRCGNYYGPWDLHLNRIIPYIVKELVNGKRPVLRAATESSRDFLYIEDAVAANILLAERLYEDGSINGEAFNFSNGTEVKIEQLANQICAEVNPSLQPELELSDKTEIHRMWLDNSKAKKVLGWSPGVSFEAGLKTTIDWYEEYFAKTP